MVFLSWLTRLADLVSWFKGWEERRRPDQVGSSKPSKMIPEFARCHLTGRPTVDYRDLRAGKVYSRVYIGDNEAYGEIDGKETFKVVQTAPELKTLTLHYQYGSGFSDQLVSSVGTYTHPGAAFAEYLVYETPDKKDWFIKAIWSTPKDAIDEGLLTSEDFRHRVELSKRPWKKGNYGQRSHSPGPGSTNFFVIRFNVKGRSAANPYLQSLVMRWESMAELRADMEKFS